ncbi:MAG: DUF2500 domain-containing protein [Clostridiales bacterium]|nr:MAG: DUF2500 domain-containing protein [Clostridiales bacterium]
MMSDIIGTVIPLLVLLVFLIVIGIAVFSVFRTISQGKKNAACPRVTAPATLVAKRHLVRGSGSTASRTWYYMTFEFESGDRAEFSVPSDVFGLSVEGDHGKLMFQGTWFISFERE